MPNITSAELTSIREQLTQEQNLIAKYRYIAGQTGDSALKQKYEDIATRHEKHFETLFGLLG